MKKLLSVVPALAVVLSLTIAGIARADTTLGSTAFPAGSTPGACNGSVIAQVTSDPSTPYTVPTPPVGPLNRWQVNTSLAAAGTPVTLVVLRSTGADAYTVVGSDTQAIPSSPPGGIATFTVASPIAVSGAEILAVYSPPSAAFACYFHDGATPAADSLISLFTAGTPAPGQGLTTNDDSGAGYTLNLSATLAAPVPAKKKCKKHKKKRSADSAKKKKCKKKKRK